MKRILFFVVCVLFSANVAAKEIAGVAVGEGAAVGGKNLVLNGAGIRTKVIFDIYVAALYLGEKSKKPEVIFADANNKRVALHILYSLKSETLLEAFKKAINANHSAAEMAAMDGQLKKFSAIFDTVAEVKKGDVILIDYIAGTGSKVTINGTERGVIEGADFNRALLKIWLGARPADEDLKKEMLGIW